MQCGTGKRRHGTPNFRNGWSYLVLDAGHIPRLTLESHPCSLWRVLRLPETSANGSCLCEHLPIPLNILLVLLFPHFLTQRRKYCPLHFYRASLWMIYLRMPPRSSLQLSLSGKVGLLLPLPQTQVLLRLPVWYMAMPNRHNLLSLIWQCQEAWAQERIQGERHAMPWSLNAPTNSLNNIQPAFPGSHTAWLLN